MCRILFVAVSTTMLMVQIPFSSSWSCSSSPSATRIAHTSALFAMSDDDEIPSMDWLTDTLSTPPKTKNTNGPYDESMVDLSSTPYLEEHDIDGDLGDVPIPTTGVSIADEMGEASKDRFYSQLVPITGLGKGVKAVRILSSTTVGAFEAVRYLIRLNKKEDEEEEIDLGLDLDAIDISDLGLDDDDDDNDEEEAAAAADSNEIDDFVMTDVPPFSEKLLKEIKSMMGPNGRLSTILVTSQECIHYDEAPGVFSVRKADLAKWKKAFPETATVAYRMDIPRDCRDSITQRLDGYGPWAMDEQPNEHGDIDPSSMFKESGLPFTVKEWDPELAEEIMTGKRKPPGEEEEEGIEVDDSVIELDANGQFTPDTIRANEEGKRVIAVYTPGRTFGSMVYVFPELRLCASGYSLPLEDSRAEENSGMDTPGPALDHRGYITTSKAGISRQVESAREMINTYIDRFDIVLTARGDPFYLDGDTRFRRETLMQTMDQYEKLGKIYEQLGI